MANKSPKLNPLNLQEPVTDLKKWDIKPRFDDEADPRENIKPVTGPVDLQAENDRLTRQLSQANATIARQDDLIKTLRKALDNVGSYLYRAYHHDEWGTRGALRRLISRVFGARDYNGHD